MRFMHKRCTDPGCDLAANGGRCQDCDKPFCRDHVAASDFTGVRRTGAETTSWTRFVCDRCAQRSHRSLLATDTRLAREQATRDGQGYWWTTRQPTQN